MASKEITAVILAGGRGARMGELTANAQKCMLPVEDRPILTHILDEVVDVFGSARLVIATGYQADSIVQNFGNRYRNIEIEYVHNPEHLETRRRLLSTEPFVHEPFLYLAGDVIANPKQMERVAQAYQSEKGNGVTGVISAATDHSPALTHALVSAEGGHAVEMVYPATANWTTDQLREMGIAYYNNNFFYLLKNARPDQAYQSHVISEAITNGVDFAVDKYFDKWYHFVKPEDLGAKIIFNG